MGRYTVFREFRTCRFRRKEVVLQMSIHLNKKMKIAILQTDIVWGKPTENVKHAEQLMERCPKADLYILPEMFSTGFAVIGKALSESEDGETLHWMRTMAARWDAAIAGSVAIKQGKQHYNRFYFVEPDGTVHHYDKRHLFAYGGEDRRYTSGERRVVVNFRGVRFLLEVCYDLRFPVWSRNRGDYDALLYVANWPTVRLSAWKTLLRARAIENQCFVVGVNRVGKDAANEYGGSSIVLNPLGEPLALCGPEREETAVAELDMAELAMHQQTFPVLRDADRFVLE